MMRATDFDEARYGNWAFSYISLDERQKMEQRQLRLWQVILDLTGSSATEPWIHCVHSPRSMPAFMGFHNEVSSLVWDAGLGTVFSKLVFPLPFAQHPKVVEATLRQLIAVRLILIGESARATAQISRVRGIFEKTPIDRTYQQNVDAEGQFEVYMLTEVQEEFVLAHELAHHLKAVDPEAFLRFEALVLRSADTHEPGLGVLGLQPFDHEVLWDAGINPFAWFLVDRDEDDLIMRARATCSEDRVHARTYFHSLPAPMREEHVCDLLASVVVAVAADRRQRGWTAAASVAIARVALLNMRLLTSIDTWIAGRGPHPVDILRKSNERERSMTGLLPGLLRSVLSDHHTQPVPDAIDLHAIMKLAETRVFSRISAGLRKIDLSRLAPTTRVMPANEILMFSGFIPTRPSASHVTTNRTANNFRFEIGTLSRSSRIVARELGNYGFVAFIDGLVIRHQRGDWGEMYDEDVEANERGLFEEFEPSTPNRMHRRDAIWSFFTTDDAQTVVVKTSRDRRVTEVLFMSEM
jgi:hypothetical protein